MEKSASRRFRGSVDLPAVIPGSSNWLQRAWLTHSASLWEGEPVLSHRIHPDTITQNQGSYTEAGGWLVKWSHLFDTLKFWTIKLAWRKTVFFLGVCIVTVDGNRRSTWVVAMCASLCVCVGGSLSLCVCFCVAIYTDMCERCGRVVCVWLCGPPFADVQEVPGG